MKGSKLRIGVAGLGFGAYMHVPILQSLQDVCVAAIAGTDKKRAQEVAVKHHVGVGCGSLEELFDQSIDGVTLALPPEFNARAARMALLRGLPVLAEKPLAHSAQAAQELEELAQDKTTMVDFYFSELAPFQALKKIIETRKYGEVKSVKVSWLVESLAQRNRTWSWKTDADRYGGVVTLLGSHILYLAEWLFGKAQGLSAETSSQATKAFAPPGANAAPDHLFFNLDFPAGISLAATVSNASPPGTGHRWEVVFEKATAVLYNPRLDYLLDFTLTMQTKTEEKIVSSSEPVPPENSKSPFSMLIRRFVDAVRSHKPTSPDFSAGARVQRLMEAVYSSAQGKGKKKLSL